MVLCRDLLENSSDLDHSDRFYLKTKTRRVEVGHQKVQAALTLGVLWLLSYKEGGSAVLLEGKERIRLPSLFKVEVKGKRRKEID